MAVLGLTKLDAVRAMMETAGETRPVPELDTGGASTAAQAERVLDRVTTSVQLDGWADNVDRCVKYMPNNASKKITVGATVIAIKSAGPNAHRNFALRGDLVRDMDKHQDTFDATDEANGIFLDTISAVPFEDCSPKTKEVILKEACKVWQRRERGSQQADGELAEEATRADVKADRPANRENVAAINSQPLIPARPADPRG